MKPCVTIIVIKSITDILAAVLNYIVSERIVSTGRIIFIVSEGPCHSYLICFLSHLFLLSLLQQNLIWLMCSYTFRYYILHFHDPTLSTFLTTAILAYFPSLFHCLFWFATYYESLQSFEQYAPHMFSKLGDLVMAGSLVHIFSLVTAVVLIALSVIALGFYFWIWFTLYKYLKENTSRLSKTLITLNTQLVKAIHFQSLIPIFTILSFVALYLMHYSYIDPYRLQMLPSIFLSSTLSIFPMSYIIFMPPYFNFCLGQPKKKIAQMVKSKLKLNSAVDIAHSSTVVYPLSTF
ncbi:hypothetical protein CAEBREN_01000 [Caenorhabditis brenneri]|uniref:Uncharacterized protein n=1 Tax=Caenorhabditis brenneri TaxID=135651 RepID=G0NMV0_CAEBE|nr:hypothetical protein CAEBREN_01000 [Caenorhabditis brenneri]